MCVPQKGKAVSTLIGDVVASRSSQSRKRLQRDLERVLGDVNEIFEPAQSLQATLGDEFQGGFADLATAVRASLVLRLMLFDTAEVDSRYGLGFGSVAPLKSRTPQLQDGPGWWSAREAIDDAWRLGSAPRTAFARTCFEVWELGYGFSAGEVAAINAMLLCRDALVDQMSERSHRLLLGRLLGRQQIDLAKAEGITQSAVSQNLTRSGAFAVEAAQRRLEWELR